MHVIAINCLLFKPQMGTNVANNKMQPSSTYVMHIVPRNRKHDTNRSI